MLFISLFVFMKLTHIQVFIKNVRVYFQYKTTKVVVYWDYTSKCTKNATTSI